MKGDKLTPKQKKFCNEYLIDLNSTQAAIRAGYSKKTADRIGPENLGKLVIQQYLKKIMGKREEKTGITQEMVVNELAAIAFSSGSDFAKVVEKTYNEPILDDKGNKIGDRPVTYKTVDLTLTDKLPEEKRKAIASIKQGKNGIEISSCDKVKALELLGKHLGMFEDKEEKNTIIQVFHNIPRPVTSSKDEED